MYRGPGSHHCRTGHHLPPPPPYRIVELKIDGYTVPGTLYSSVGDPNTLNLDPDTGFWLNLDSDPDPGPVPVPDPGFYYQF